MDRKEAEDFVYKSYQKARKYQDYQAKDAGKRRPELTRDIIRARAGTPCVVVTGSKGKGSVANMISNVLRARHCVGLMTSPHLSDFCERFRVNGTPISDDAFVEQMHKIRPEIEAIEAALPPDVCISPMGIQAALALSYFASEHTDFNVFECGKGVRYDDVNNVRHEYAVINSIFLEHTRELGETAEEIAADKSCVITGEQTCVYVAEQTPGVMEVIEKRAARLNVPLKRYGRDFRAGHIRYGRGGMLFEVTVGQETYPDISIPLLGEHQARNCALALALCRDVLGDFDVEKVKKKLRALDWPGRMEVLSAEPFVMLDACIHPASCGSVKEVLAHLNITDAAVVIGIPDDKDYAGVAKSMREVAADIILTKSQNPHYVFTQKQQRKLAEEGIAAVWTNSVREALRIAKERGGPVVILGTTSVVAEVKKVFDACRTEEETLTARTKINTMNSETGALCRGM